MFRISISFNWICIEHNNEQLCAKKIYLKSIVGRWLSLTFLAKRKIKKVRSKEFTKTRLCCLFVFLSTTKVPLKVGFKECLEFLFLSTGFVLSITMSNFVRKRCIFKSIVGRWLSLTFLAKRLKKSGVKNSPKHVYAACFFFVFRYFQIFRLNQKKIQVVFISAKGTEYLQIYYIFATQCCRP